MWTFHPDINFFYAVLEHFHPYGKTEKERGSKVLLGMTFSGMLWKGFLH